MKSLSATRATFEEPLRESSCFCEAPIAWTSGCVESDTLIRLKLTFSPSQHAERIKRWQWRWPLHEALIRRVLPECVRRSHRG